MQKVITINLNGNAYQVDEGGYASLLTYLDGAQRQLLDNPDRVEIIADLEQAIADKCGAFLGPHKTVVTSPEVDQIIREMGPVDGSAGASSASDGAPATGASGGEPRTPPPPAPRRLYIIHEGAMLAGVCTGLAAYIHLDVTIIRIIFVLLAIVTRGGFALVYLALAVVIPPADTSEQRAEAHGQRFNAQELIDQAKKQYASFTASSGWGWRRQQRRMWRAQRRAARWGWGAGSWTAPPAPPIANPYGGRIITSALIPFLSLVSMLIFAAWALAMYSLVTSGEILGQALPEDVPSWVGILALVVVYHLIVWPLHFARRRAAYYAVGGGYHYRVLAAWDTLLTMGFGIFVVWVAYQYIPEVREVLRAVPDVLRSFGIYVS